MKKKIPQKDDSAQHIRNPFLLVMEVLVIIL